VDVSSLGSVRCKQCKIYKNCRRCEGCVKNIDDENPEVMSTL
jgi:hypothetical protein